MKRFLIPAALLLCLNVYPQSLAIENLVAVIVENNPDLIRSGLANQAAAMEAVDANALPNPSIEFTHVWGRAGVGNKMQVDVSQEFEWPFLYATRHKASVTGLSAAQMAYRRDCLDLGLEARNLLMELVYIRAQKAFLQDLDTRFSQLSDAIEKSVSGGELSLIDSRKAQIEHFKIENQRSEVQASELELMGRIQALSSVLLDLEGVTDYPLCKAEELQAYLDAMVTDPEVQQYSLQAESRRLEAKAATQMRFPDITLGYEFQSEMGDRFDGITVGLSVPLFQNRKAGKTARIAAQAAQLEVENIDRVRRIEIENAYAEYLLYKDRYEDYVAVFGDRRYIESLEKARSGGQLSVVEYINELNYYEQSMLEFLATEFNYHRSLARLDRYLSR